MTASFSDVLKWLGERHDGFLISGAVLYGLGYLVWSYNAWRNNLGQLPALEFQYLIAGIIPAVIIAVAWAAVAFFYTATDKTVLLIERHPSLNLLTIAFLLFVIAGGLLLGGLAIHRRWIPKEKIGNYLYPLFVITVYLSVVMGLRLSQRIRAKRVPNHLARINLRQHALITIYRFLLPAVFCWCILRIYLDLYPALPQELGGPQPRCAYVDLVRDETSPSTMSALVSAQPTDIPSQSGAKVVRSDKLYVYFSSGDYLLVRLANTNDKRLKPEELPLYQLRKEVIRAVRWCK
jgi:hypothetical protein